MNLRTRLKEDGWFVVRGVLGEEDIRVARDRLREICANIDHYRPYIPGIRPAKNENLAQNPDPNAPEPV